MSAAKGVGDFRRQFDSYHTVEDRRKVDGFHGLIPPVTLLQATRRVRAGMRTSGTAPPHMLKPLTSLASCSASEPTLRATSRKTAVPGTRVSVRVVPGGPGIINT